MTPILGGMLIALLVLIYLRLTDIHDELKQHRPAKPREWKDQ